MRPAGGPLFGRSASLVYRSSPKLLRWRLALFRPTWLLRWSLQWRRLFPSLDADADRVDLESRLIELLLEDRARLSVCRTFSRTRSRRRSPRWRRLQVCPSVTSRYIPHRTVPRPLGAPPPRSCSTRYRWQGSFSRRGLF